MRKNILSILISFLLFALSIYSFFLYSNSLEVIENKVPAFEEVLSAENIKLDRLKLSTDYIPILRAGIESDKLTASKMPMFRQALPTIKALLLLEEKVGGNINVSEIKLASDLKARISKTLRYKSNGTYEVIVPLSLISKVSSEDYLKIKYEFEKGSMMNPRVSFYQVADIFSFLYFHPLVLAIIGLSSFLIGTVFLFVPVFRKIKILFTV